MSLYEKRKIQFKELVEIDGWKIKIYTISKDGNFNYNDFYKNVFDELPEWLKLKNNFNSNNDKIGFLILHPGREGIFSLINWWVGKNMLNTNIYLTNPEIPNKFKKISGEGLSACVWELAIINHESVSWLNNILKKETEPQYEHYLKDVLDIII